jgi:DNA polymerase-3 subunit epsilon
MMPMLNVGESIIEQPLVFVDIETNGLNHIRGRVIEVAAIRVEGGRITRVFNQLIDPGSELPQFITSLTGIRNEDLRGAQTFHQIAGELQDILDGAIFIAHNVRFDYSFLKQEFKRTGRTFLPKQLCTVKLSRTLYPDQTSHKLENLIRRHGFTYQQRHRAYDDAHVLWQFIQLVHNNFPPEIISAAVAKQIRRPAIPKDIPQELIKDLPETPGVYIFEDEQNKPLYIGKSINIRKRVLQHFGHDHDDSKEFKIAQSVKNISTITTGGELEALLLESNLVKEMHPLYNRKLRRMNKLTLAKGRYDDNGYLNISLEEAHQLEPEDISSTLAVYPRRSRAKDSLNDIQKLYELCPKLLGLEKCKSACFLYQLHKCRGACAGHEPAEDYNKRALLAFERQRIAEWPYSCPVLLQEKSIDGMQPTTGVVIDQWCVIAEVHQDEYCEPEVKTRRKTFDLDTYKILQSFIETKPHKLKIQPLSPQHLQSLNLA